MGAVADDQVRVDRHAARGERLDFGENRRRIDHHAVGDDALDVVAEDAAGNQRELELLPVEDDGVPGVGAPLIADDNVVLFGEKIDDLPFRFITPLQTDNGSRSHSFLLTFPFQARPVPGRPFAREPRRGRDTPLTAKALNRNTREYSTRLPRLEKGLIARIEKCRYNRACQLSPLKK